MKCRHCGNTHFQKRGTYSQALGTKTLLRYQCKKCKRFVQSEPRHRRSAKILLLDIETSLMKFYGFSPKTEYIPHELMICDWSVLCWGAKWLFEPETMGESVTPKESVAREDSRILEGMWKLIDQADIVVTQNGIAFDLKKLNSRFLLSGFPPPSHFLNVDTLKVSKEVFGWSYNRLDFLGQKFGIGKKTDMEIEDWIACSEGSQAHLTKMFEYCKRDVAPLLEDVYLKILPWIPNHPNLNIFTEGDGDCCPKCESTDLSWNNTYKTAQGLWEGFRCNSCGAVGRGTSSQYKIKSVSIK